MQKSIAEILKGLPQKPPRSKLEPHYELIRQLRRRSMTYREIAHVLHDQVGLQVDHTTICDFVRIRSRRAPEHSQAGQLPPRPLGESETQLNSGASPRFKPEPDADSLDTGFRYNKDEPLRLISGKDKNGRK